MQEFDLSDFRRGRFLYNITFVDFIKLPIILLFVYVLATNFFFFFFFLHMMFTKKVALKR